MSNGALLAVSMTACLAGGIAKKYYTDRCGGARFSRHIFNMVSSAVAALILLALSFGNAISPFTVILGILFGTVTALQQIFCLKAMENGPWSYTSVITSLSMIIPTLSGTVFWNEKIYPVQIIGFVLTVLCIILSQDLKGPGSKTGKWGLYCAVAFIATGIIGILQKWHQSTEFKNEANGFLLIAFTVSFVISALACLFNRKCDMKQNNKNTPLSLVPILATVIAGVAIVLNNILNLKLSGIMDSAVFFPAVNGGGLVLTTISAMLLFKEKLKKKQWIGMFFGAAAVILLCNPF